MTTRLVGGRLRVTFYRWIHQVLFEKIAERVASQKWARADDILGSARTRIFANETPEHSHVWFHAASVGELESLWTVIDAWIEKGGRASISIFSKSAEKSLMKLKEDLGVRAAQIGYLGYSPWEGRWGEFLTRIKPDVFVTAKYEAWPELWLSLAEQKIPLVVVGAKKRCSYIIAQKMCSLLGGQTPHTQFLSVSAPDAEELRVSFPETAGARIRVVGEPRWDRVAKRLEKNAAKVLQNSQAWKVAKRFEHLPKPWGVLGSAWLEDLHLWKVCFKEVRGTLWIVPHSIDQSYLFQIEKFMGEQGFEISRTSVESKRGGGRTCVLVDQMGFLAEFYSFADWAYVGGGFGKGVHSTIEPALQAIPIAVGPARIESFSEIFQLKDLGILSVVRNSAEILEWVKNLRGSINAAQGLDLRVRWRQEISKKLGATQGVVSVIDAILMKLSE
ncbi:glycosyltransferase N-terminal domain-containing protein [Bdellovibrionota bacterium FG-2]